MSKIYEETYQVSVRIGYDPSSAAFKKTWSDWLVTHPDPFWHSHEKMLGWVATCVWSYYRQHGDYLESVPYVGGLVPKRKGYSGIYVEYCGWTPAKPQNDAA